MRLRFAVLLLGDGLEQWHLSCLDQLDSVASLAAVIAPSRQPASAGRRGPAERWLARGVNTAADLPERFRSLERRVALPDDALELEREEWDVVLKLGCGVLPKGLEKCARLGVWYFEHEQRAASLPFFSEVYDGEDVTEAALLALPPGGDRPVVLEQGFFRTESRSYRTSRRRVVDAAATWPARVCRRLATGSLSGGSDEPEGTFGRIGSSSTDLSLSRYYARVAARRLRVAERRLFRHPQWNIGILDAPAGSLVDSTYEDDRIEWFPLPDRKAFVADPFGVERDGTLHVLCERFEYGSSKGHICSFEMAAGRPPTTPEHAIDLPIHLSYPFLVELQEAGRDEIYCIPESSAANEIALFRAERFPRAWSKTAVLIEGFPGVDPTVFQHEETWWLMCTKQGPLEDVELWAWHASDLRGPWLPHARNPIKSDVRSSRPAGRPFHHRGSLYRPAQDCSRSYGWRIALNRVVRLTPTDFAEETVRVLEASPRSAFPSGRHTLTAVGDKLLVDGRREVFVWAAFVEFLRIWATDWARHVPGLRGRSRSPAST